MPFSTNAKAKLCSIFYFILFTYAVRAFTSNKTDFSDDACVLSLVSVSKNTDFDTFSTDGTLLFKHKSDQIQIVDPTTLKLVASMPIPKARHCSIVSNGPYLYVLNKGAKRLKVVNGFNYRFIHELIFCEDSAKIETIFAVDKFVYIAVSDIGDQARVLVFNTVTSEIVETIIVEKAMSQKSCQFALYGDFLFLLNRGCADSESSISVLNIKQQKLVATISLEEGVREIAVNKDYVFVYYYSQKNENPYVYREMDTYDGRIEVIDKNTGKTLHSIYSGQIISNINKKFQQYVDIWLSLKRVFNMCRDLSTVNEKLQFCLAGPYLLYLEENNDLSILDLSKWQIVSRSNIDLNLSGKEINRAMFVLGQQLYVQSRDKIFVYKVACELAKAPRPYHEQIALCLLAGHKDTQSIFYAIPAEIISYILQLEFESFDRYFAQDSKNG